MTLDFDLNCVIVTEFGIGRDDGSVEAFTSVPVGAEVQTVLLDMAKSTWQAMKRDEEGPTLYKPSEKHSAIEYLYLPVTSDLAGSLLDLHTATNLPIDSTALEQHGEVFSYFSRFTDKSNRRLTALRRASQFKGVLKSRNHLVRMIDNTLHVIPDAVFKLDFDFDLLIDSKAIHILRPSGFEFAGKLQQAIQDAAPQNIAAIGKDLPFVVFDDIIEYACRHPRAARYLASIRSQSETKNIDKTLLVNLCRRTAVGITERDGKVTIDKGHELGFLEVLDRRRYEISLVKERPEHYRAASRTKIDN